MCVDWLFARAKNRSSFSPALKSSSNPAGPLPLRFFWPQLTRLFEIYPQLLSPASSPLDLLLTLFQPPHFAPRPEFSHGSGSASRWVALNMVGLRSRQQDKAENGWSWGELDQQSLCPKEAFDQGGSDMIVRHLRWWLGHGSRDYMEPWSCLRRKGTEEAPPGRSKQTFHEKSRPSQVV